MNPIYFLLNCDSLSFSDDQNIAPDYFFQYGLNMNSFHYLCRVTRSLMAINIVIRLFFYCHIVAMNLSNSATMTQVNRHIFEVVL